MGVELSEKILEGLADAEEAYVGERRGGQVSA
jgi:hypothetical protein